MTIAKWDCSKQEYVEIKVGKDWVPKLKGQARLVTTRDNYGRCYHVGELLGKASPKVERKHLYVGRGR